MENNKFLIWCQAATEKIRYGPDRKAVSQELMAHLEDHRDALMAQGMSKEEAERKAVTAMGSASEIAPQLAAIHSPWLGYLLSIVRAATVITALFTIFYCMVTLGSFAHNIVSANRFDSLPANFGPLDYYDHPNVRDASDGRYYQVTEAGYSKAEAELYAEIRTIYWPHFRYMNGFVDFWAVDSFGNYYVSIREAAYDDIPRIKRAGYATSECIAHYTFILSDFHCEAEWVELHYDRDGRDIVLRIDLTGGGENG